jgi:thioredoxin reductase
MKNLEVAVLGSGPAGLAATPALTRGQLVLGSASPPSLGPERTKRDFLKASVVSYCGGGSRWSVGQVPAQGRTIL